MYKQRSRYYNVKSQRLWKCDWLKSQVFFYENVSPLLIGWNVEQLYQFLERERELGQSVA